MTDSILQKPRLVSTGQGFSVLNTVLYRQKYLYSKYSPDRTILSAIQQMKIPAGTLVIICSPGLWYGIEQLKAKLPEDCEIAAFEAEQELYDFSKEYNSQQIKFFNTLTAEDFFCYIKQLTSKGKIRRVLRIDFSAGVQFNTKIFEEIVSTSQNLTGTFWKNRITLVKMGRLYARNIFKNLPSLKDSFTLKEVSHSVSKPILVCGAGESLNKTVRILSLQENRNLIKEIFILASDAALTVLNSAKIIPDAVIGLEGQQAIEKAYIGSAGKKITLFTDLASRPSIKNILGGQTVFFSTKYTDAAWLDNLEKNNLIDGFIPPLGSVGIAAVYIALEMRLNNEVPVFLTGLDFSYSCGKTHASGTFPHLSRLFTSSRFLPVENYSASFGEGCSAVSGKQNKVVYTGKNLYSYAKVFNDSFSSSENIFDIGTTGVPLLIESSGIDKLLLAAQKNSHTDYYDEKYSSEIKNNNPDSEKIIQASDSDMIMKTETVRKNLLTSENKLTAQVLHEQLCVHLKEFYEQEINALATIKDLLSNGDKSEYRDFNRSLSQQLKDLIQERDYLYLHFPDGFTFTDDISFLKRIRAEIDFFIKDSKSALYRLN